MNFNLVYSNLQESTDEETVCVLIGNKSDLAENVPAMRKVSAASGERLAHVIHPFINTAKEILRFF